MVNPLSAGIQPDEGLRPPLSPVRGIPHDIRGEMLGSGGDLLLQDPGKAGEGVKQYTKDVLSRLRESVEAFSDGLQDFDSDIGDKVNPVQSASFLHFVRETLSEVHARYVATGRFTPPGLPNDESPEAGLPGAVSGAPEENVDIPAGLDPALAHNPAVRLALARGVNLVDDED